MLAHWYGLLFLGDAPPPKPQLKQGGLGHLKAQLRKEETEEEKQLRREAQGIIQRIKEAKPAQVEQIQDDSKRISAELKEAIIRFELAAAGYQARLEHQQAINAQQQAAAYQSLLIEAQLQAEQLQQQVEEMDVCYIIFMLSAHDSP